MAGNSRLNTDVAVHVLGWSFDPMVRPNMSIAHALVSVVRKERGVMSEKKPEDVELFQFLAQMLMARGNTVSYSSDDWIKLKTRLQEDAYF